MVFSRRSACGVGVGVLAGSALRRSRFGVLAGGQLLDADAERPREPQREQHGRHVPARLQGDDRLAGDPYPVGRRLLGHLVALEPKPPGAAGDSALRLRRHWTPSAGTGPG